MADLTLTPPVIALVARRFKALAEPARLEILSELRDGPLNVSELVELTGHAQATVSKHLGILHRMGFVSRERRGTFVIYALADDDVFALCDLMCGRVQRELLHRPAFLSS